MKPLRQYIRPVGVPENVFMDGHKSSADLPAAGKSTRDAVDCYVVLDSSPKIAMDALEKNVKICLVLYV